MDCVQWRAEKKQFQQLIILPMVNYLMLFPCLFHILWERKDKIKMIIINLENETNEVNHKNMNSIYKNLLELYSSAFKVLCTLQIAMQHGVKIQNDITLL